jgi:Type II CAAX prenyl endopeptidase Rce1-like
MRQAPPEVAVTFVASVAFWALLVVIIFLAGRRSERVQHFWQLMVAQRNPALVIAALYMLGSVVAARLDFGTIIFSPLGGLLLFCQGLIGLALARSIAKFEPLPVADAIIHCVRPWRSVALMLGIGLLAGAMGLVVGSIGMSIVQQLVGETVRSGEAVKLLPADKLLAFFSLLSGAAIAEETPYRLVVCSLVWWLTGRRGLAIFISALVFAAYHLIPLDGMYQLFWQYPVSQFISTVLIGLIWGFIYTRRGYETVVVGHALTDWITVLLFT